MDWDKALKKLPAREKSGNETPERDYQTRPAVETLQFEQLDDATQVYLRQVRELRGSGMPGIYAPKTNYLPIAGLIVGIVILVIGMIATLPPGPFDQPVNTALLQGAFLLLGGWMIIAAFRVWAGASRTAGYFVYADSRRLYDCNGGTVKIIELSGLVEADGTHNYNEGKYQNTAIALRLSKGKESITVHSEEPGRQMIVFLNCITWLDSSELKNLPPHVRGGLAREVARTGQMPGEFHESDVAVTQVPEPERTGMARSGLLAYLLIIGVAVGGVLLLIPINRDLRDDNIFMSVTAPGHGGPKDLRAYLIALPDGKHREEVERLLASHYQAALGTLRAAAQKSELAKGPLEIVEGIKTAKHPGVSIRVREVREVKKPGEPFSDANMTARRKAVQEPIINALTQVVGFDKIDFAELQGDDGNAMIDVSYRVIPEKDDGKGYQIEMTASFRKRPDEPEIISKKLPPVNAGSRTPELKSAVDSATRALLREAGLPDNPKPAAPPPLFPKNF